jgi:putative ABC transport system permease protein
MDTSDISYLSLFIGYLILIIPVYVFWYYKTGLIRSTLIAAFRMAVQLILVGIYLEYIFRWNNPWINIAWVAVMVVVGSFTVVNRSGIRRRYFLVPVMAGLVMSIIIIDAWLLGVVIRLEHFFESRYFIPITGLVLGNSIRITVIALNSYFNRLRKDELLYRYHLANGATRSEALQPYISEAIQVSNNPNIATMAIMGLIALPGTMTGQLIGGSSPGVAIKYQIMLMLAVFVSSLISVIVTILVSNRYSFNRQGLLKAGVLTTDKPVKATGL